MDQCQGCILQTKATENTNMFHAFFLKKKILILQQVYASTKRGNILLSACNNYLPQHRCLKIGIIYVKHFDNPYGNT